MKLNRRQFLLLTAGFVAGCQTGPEGPSAGPQIELVLDAGPASNYLADGVYTQFLDQGFFIVRQGARLFALSSFCTHRKCKLEAESDHSFYCKCHGSTFDPDGHVTEGPARRDLPMFPATIDAGGRLRVRITRA